VRRQGRRTPPLGSSTIGAFVGNRARARREERPPEQRETEPLPVRRCPKLRLGLVQQRVGPIKIPSKDAADADSCRTPRPRAREAVAGRRQQLLAPDVCSTQRSAGHQRRPSHHTGWPAASTSSRSSDHPAPHAQCCDGPGRDPAAIVAAVFVSNLPELIAASDGMERSATPPVGICDRWLALSELRAIAAAGYGSVGALPIHVGVLVQAFAASAPIAVLGRPRDCRSLRARASGLACA
jgi:hypothetical protein